MSSGSAAASGSSGRLRAAVRQVPVGRDTDANRTGDGLTMLGIALFVVPPLFVVGTLLTG